MVLKKKRHFLILEVLIAFGLVVLCVLPLIYPHLYITQEQRKFIDKIDLDIAVNQFYAEIMQRLYKNEILWSDIDQNTVFPIDQDFLSRLGYTAPFPFKGTYQLTVIRRKQNPQYGLYRLGLTMAFTSASQLKIGSEVNKQSIYEYEIFASRLYSPQASPESSSTQPSPANP